MAGYLNQNGNSIGSLLRFIEEQKSQSPMVPPGTELGSPIRGMTQEPLKGSESVGTTRVVSIKPESVLGQTGETSPSTSPSGEVLPVGGSTAQTMGGPALVRSSSSGEPFPTPVPTPTRPAGTNPVTVSSPTLGTKISTTPAQSRIGAYVLDPKFSQTQSGNVSNQGSATVYKQTGSTVPYPTLGPTPAPTASRFLPEVNFNKTSSPSLGTIISGSVGQAWKKLWGK